MTARNKMRDRETGENKKLIEEGEEGRGEGGEGRNVLE